MSDDNSTKPPIGIVEERETYIRPDGTTYTRDEIYVKLYVTFRDTMLAKLKGARLSVYLCIALHCGEDMTSYPSLNTICKETGYSKPAVTKAVAGLVKDGLIERRKRRTKAGDHDSNIYTVKGYIAMGRPEPKGVVKKVNHRSKLSLPRVVNSVDQEEEPLEEHDDDDGQPAAQPLDLNPVLSVQDMCQSEALWALRFVGVDDDAAQALARTHDPDAVRSWCCVAWTRHGPDGVTNMPGFVRSKLDDGAATPEVAPAQMQEFMKWVTDHRAAKAGLFEQEGAKV